MSKLVRPLLLALALATALGPTAASAGEEPVAKRVAVGQMAPDFTLPGLDGESHTLSALRGEKRAVLVFFRGAW